MSLESQIELLTAAVDRLALALNVKVVPLPAAAPVVQPTPAPVAPAAAAPVPVAVQPVMPEPPSFAPPMPPPVQAAPRAVAPFADSKGLIAYTMDSYKALGPVKGGQIQKILADLGVTNINDVPVDKYVQFHAAVEALKA